MKVRFLLYGFILMILSAWMMSCSKNSELPSQAVSYVDLSLSVESGFQNASITKGAIEDDKEMIHTIRFIIVREDGIVEHNLFDSLLTPQKELYNYSFKVRSKEKKTIYTVANENAFTNQAYGHQWRYIKYEFSKIVENEPLPSDLGKAIVRRYGAGDINVDGTLPMSAVQYIQVGDNNLSSSVELQYTAVKFTVNLINLSAHELTVDSFKLHKFSDMAFLFKQPDGESRMPQSVTYENYIRKESLYMQSGDTLKLSSIYLLEGYYKDNDSPQNYSMEIFVNGQPFTKNLPNFSELPRGTHILVNASINSGYFNISVFPWGTYLLYPVFE